MVTLPDRLADDSSGSLGFAFRMQREVDEKKTNTATTQGFTPLSQFLPDSYFADDETYKQGGGFSVWGSRSDKSTPLPGEYKVLVRKGIARKMADDKFDALALVLTACRLTKKQVKDGNVWPEDQERNGSQETFILGVVGSLVY